VNSKREPHSADQFGPQRDFWWNLDFLDLMARRWRLQEAGSLADIGCGVGHWSRLLYPHLRPPARLAAVDREPRWIAEAERRFRGAFPQVPADLLTFVQGDATRIPLPSDAFDVVTCQTLLMHLPQPLDALREMRRIVRPGGLLVCVEPSNLWNYLPFTSLTGSESTEALLARFEFWLRCHRGRIKAGLGDHNFGDLLPGYFAQLGLVDVAVYQSDRAAAVFPPYDKPYQQAILEQEWEWKHRGAGPFNREELRRLLLLGGGSDELFERVFPQLLRNHERQEDAVAAGTFHAGYGAATYLVSGRRKD
jgi:SAM-dependent methyltransferase